MDSEYPAHAAQSKLTAMLINESVLYSDTLAKYAAAFFGGVQNFV
jgi:hypothetical protein